MPIAPRDWRDAAAYKPLLAGDRRCFAWEWLRRAPAYTDAWQAGGAPEPFGLLRLEDPALDALGARPLWSACMDRTVLHATGRPAEDDDHLDLARLSQIATTMYGDDGTEHILLSDGLRSIRLDLVVPVGAQGPLSLTWHIDGVTELGHCLSALARLSMIAKRGGFSSASHRIERRAHRWVSMLRVHDAIDAGATSRQIVGVLFGITVVGPRWRLDNESFRLRVQRLAAGAGAFIAAGPRGWLSR